MIVQEGGGPLALRIVDAPAPEVTSTDQPPPPTRIEQALLAAPAPRKARELRALCRLRGETLYATLHTLLADGRVIRTPGGYSLFA